MNRISFVLTAWRAAMLSLGMLVLGTLLLGTLSLGMLIAPAAQAQGKPQAPQSAALPAWEQLSPAQRDAMIAVLRERWNSNPAQRARMLQHAERWGRMTPEQRRNAHRGMDRWSRMNPQQQQHYRAMYDYIEQLPPEQRQALREKIKTMTPQQRREWWMRVRREKAERRP